MSPLEHAQEDVFKDMEFVATIEHDGQVIARVFSKTTDGLAMKLRHLDTMCDQYVEEEARERLQNGFYDQDWDNLAKEAR